MLLIMLTLALSWAVLTLSRYWGAASGQSAEFLDVGDCPLPCWQSLQPGTARISDLQRCFDTLDAPCNITVSFNASGTAIDRLRLNLSTNEVRLGDIIALWGPPSHVQMQYGLVRGDARRPVVIAHLYFADGLVRVMAAREDTTWRLIPSMRVRLVEYYAPNAAGGVVPIGTEQWQGFKQTYRIPR